MSLLESINSPKDIKKLSLEQLPILCSEIREFIIENLSSNPGHLGSSLGTVEMTVAIHYVYDTPNDSLVWDVGHQAYAHKILTGRRDLFKTNRTKDGISGFPKRSESIYDSFGGGHASVSISAALGMDVANQLSKNSNRTIAVIGDGALTGGLAFEGMNNSGFSGGNILVILNDNDMSIDPNVGALKEYLLQITTSAGYNQTKSFIKSIFKKSAIADRAIRKLWCGIKSSILTRGNLFEALGFRYFGITDGHDVLALVKTLSDIKDMKRPKLLHVVTTKGKGYAPAESSKTVWHAPGEFDKITGKRISESSDLSMKYQDVFGETLLELAKENPKIVGITPAMPSGCSMSIMQNEIPERVFDVGIAEGHAVTFSGGLATQGFIPFCNIYSTFMQRAIDNVIHDVALQDVNVVFCLDRAGLVGEDGVTHHGLYDIAFFKVIPNAIIASPINEHELRDMMYTAQNNKNGIFVIRYPRGRGTMKKEWRNKFEQIEIGKSKTIKEGNDCAILSFGNIGNMAIEAIEKFEKESNKTVKHVDLRFAKPLDSKMLHEIGKNFSKIITIEDATIIGGVGSSIIEFMNDNGYNTKVTRLGVPDKFIQHAKVSQLMNQCEYDTEAIRHALEEICK